LFLVGEVDRAYFSFALGIKSQCLRAEIEHLRQVVGEVGMHARMFGGACGNAVDGFGQWLRGLLGQGFGEFDPFTPRQAAGFEAALYFADLVEIALAVLFAAARGYFAQAGHLAGDRAEQVVG